MVAFFSSYNALILKEEQFNNNNWKKMCPRTSTLSLSATFKLIHWIGFLKVSTLSQVKNNKCIRRIKFLKDHIAKLDLQLTLSLSFLHLNILQFIENVTKYSIYRVSLLIKTQTVTLPKNTCSVTTLKWENAIICISHSSAYVLHSSLTTQL